MLASFKYGIVCDVYGQTKSSAASWDDMSTKYTHTEISWWERERGREEEREREGERKRGGEGERERGREGERERGREEEREGGRKGEKEGRRSEWRRDGD